MSYLFLDIETIPDLSRIKGTKWYGEKDTVPTDQLIPVDQLVAKTAVEISAYVKMHACPANYLELLRSAEIATKNRDTVIKSIQSACSNNDGWTKTASLCPELCKIICFGFGFDTDDSVHADDAIIGGDTDLVICSDVLSDMEEEGLRKFWELARTRQIVGYNCLGFDLPVIFARSAILGITPSRSLDIGRYTKSVIDLYIKRFGNYPPSGHPADQKSLCRLYGMEVGDMDGSKVFDLWQSGQTQEIADYQLSDLQGLRFLFRSWMGFFVN